MKEVHNFLFKLVGDLAFPKWITALATAIVGYVLPTQAMQTAAVGAIALIALDTLTGLRVAMRDRQVSSRKFGRVIDKLIAFGSLLAVIAIVTRNIPGGLSFQAALLTAALTCVIVTEAISILENIHKLGYSTFGLEKWLKERLTHHEIKPEPMEGQ